MKRDDWTSALREVFAPRLIEGWRRRGIRSLLPVQTECLAHLLKATDDSKARNLLIAAPTSSGKTLAAELAIAFALTSRRKTIYLVPTRALAGEKSTAFAEWLSQTGLRVACATRDHPETDRVVARGQFDLLVAVYEKMNHYLRASPQILAGVGVVAIDELQMIGDKERGGPLDLLATKILLSPHRPQIVGMASGIPDDSARNLAKWLDAQIILSHDRPRELREGVLDLSSGRFRYRVANCDTGAFEKMARTEVFESWRDQIAHAAGCERATDSCVLPLLAVAAERIRQREQVIIFAPTRSDSVRWALELARAGSDTPAARIALGALRHVEPGRAAELLATCLERGVAFHNADLPDALRHIVEDAFRKDEIRALVSTPTLGTGVNISARNVIQFPWCIASDPASARSVRTPISRAKFSNQGGRAARFGQGEIFGRSMLVARDSAEADRLWEEIILASPEELSRPLDENSLPRAILEILTSTGDRSVEEIQSVLNRTFSAPSGSASASRVASNSDSADRPYWADVAALRESLAACEEQQLVRRHTRRSKLESWSLTGFGEAIARSGLSIETACALRQETASMATVTDGAREADIYLTLAMTVEGRQAISGLGASSGFFSPEPRSEDPADLLNGGGIEEDSRVRHLLERSGGPTREELNALRAAQLLVDWTDGMANEILERKFRVLHGSILRVASDFQWLLHGWAAIANTANSPAPFSARLRTLAERTLPGVPEFALALWRLKVPGLTRTPLLQLLQTGTTTPRAVIESGMDSLVSTIDPDLASALRCAASNALRLAYRDSVSIPKSTASITAQPNPPKPGNLSLKKSTPIPAPSDYLLEINLKSPGIIRASGTEIRLPPLSFDLLAALAERPGEVVTRQALYNRLWGDDGPDVEQLDDHRRRLIQKLKPQLGASAPGVAEVVRGIGFRFAHDSTRLHFRRD